MSDRSAHMRSLSTPLGGIVSPAFAAFSQARGGGSLNAVEIEEYSRTLHTRGIPEETVDIQETTSRRRSSGAHKTSLLFNFFKRYVPTALVHRFVEPLPNDPVPEIAWVDAAVAFVDISGFTKLSEALASQYGANGAEMLNKYISGYFQELITVIQQHGGDVVKFAGDAMLVVWRNHSNQTGPSYSSSGGAMSAYKRSKLVTRPRGNALQSSQSPSSPHGNDSTQDSLNTLIIRAIACNLELMEKLNKFKVTDDIILTLHSGIGCGKLACLIVGGAHGLWEYFVAGEPISEMSAAGDEAASGEIIISQHCYQLVAEKITKCKINVSGNVSVESMSSLDVPKKPLVIPHVTLEMEQPLYSFIPPLVKDRIESGGFAYGAEYRKAYIMFIKLPALDFDSPVILEQLQTAVCAIQECVLRYDGMIARLLTDDKGTRFKIVFGMPSQVHVDDGARAVLTVLEISKKLKSQGMRMYAGLSFGSVFCGEAGSQERCEYTAVGFKVNLAARLMQKAETTGNGILCDQGTFDHTRNVSGIELTSVPPIRVKGISEPVPVYRPTVARNSGRERSGTIKNVSPAVLDMSPESLSAGLVGRAEETQTILSLAQNWVLSLGASYCVLVEGQCGVGKTALIAKCGQFLESEANMFVFYGTASLLEQSTPFRVWRPVLRAMLRRSSPNEINFDKIVLDKLGPEYSHMAGILNNVLGTQFPETAFTSQMSADGRSENTRKLVLKIVSSIVDSQKCHFSMVIDDMQWADSASWKLAFDLAKGLTSTFMILSSRPLDKPEPADYLSLLSLGHCSKMQIQPFDQDMCEKLMMRQLAASSVESRVSALVHMRSQGHPLYIEELVKSLLGKGLIRVESGKVEATETLTEEVARTLPNTMEDIIVSRIDGLPFKVALVLKVASVIKKDILVSTVTHVNPDSLDHDEIEELLCELVSQGFLNNVGGVFNFTHQLFQEVVYQFTLLQHRRGFHAAVLDHYESTGCGDSYILAHHGIHSEQRLKALEYSELAGMEAFLGRAVDEAIRFFQICLDLTEPNRTDKRTQFQMLIGESYYMLGMNDEAIKSLKIALELNQTPLPDNIELAAKKLAILEFLSLSDMKESRNLAFFQDWVEELEQKGVSLIDVNATESVPSNEEQVRVLELLSWASLYSGKLYLAAYCTFKLLLICQTLKGPNVNSIEASGYSFAAYLGLAMGKAKIGKTFRDACNATLQTYPNIPEIDRGNSLMILAMFAAAHASWDTALKLFKEAKGIFKLYGERKKWRECTLMIGSTLYFKCNLHECQVHFSKLLDYAEEDGDLFLMNVAMFWKAFVEYEISGSKPYVGALLRKASRNWKESEIGLRILLCLNNFDDQNSRRTVFDALLNVFPSMSENATATPEELSVFLNKLVSRMVSSSGILWYQFIQYELLLQLLLEGVHLCSPDSALKQTLLVLSNKLVDSLRSLPFPCTKCFVLVEQGLVECSEGNVTTAVECWKKGREIAGRYDIHSIEALCLFHLGCTVKNEAERVHYLLSSKSMLEKYGLTELRWMDDKFNEKTDIDPTCLSPEVVIAVLRILYIDNETMEYELDWETWLSPRVLKLILALSDMEILAFAFEMNPELASSPLNTDGDSFLLFTVKNYPHLVEQVVSALEVPMQTLELSSLINGVLDFVFSEKPTRERERIVETVLLWKSQRHLSLSSTQVWRAHGFTMKSIPWKRQFLAFVLTVLLSLAFVKASYVNILGGAIISSPSLIHSACGLQYWDPTFGVCSWSKRLSIGLFCLFLGFVLGDLHPEVLLLFPGLLCNRHRQSLLEGFFRLTTEYPSSSPKEKVE